MHTFGGYSYFFYVMATAQAKIFRTSALDDIRVVLSFFAGGLASGFVFAWAISRPSLQQFWYIKGDKFLIPRFTYYTAFGLIFLLGLATSYGVARFRRWLVANVVSSTNLFRSALIIGASASALYFVIRLMEPRILEWELIIGPLAFLAVLSVAFSVATRTLRLLPIVFVWNGIFGAAGIVMIYAIGKFAHPPTEWYDFVQWPILESMLALSFGNWIIWRERLVGERTAEQPIEAACQ
jgi:hypothetical protein